MGNISFSLFQFGGPAALLARSKLDYDSLEEEIAGGISPDLSVNCGGISPNLSVNRHGGHDACSGSGFDPPRWFNEPSPPEQ